MVLLGRKSASEKVASFLLQLSHRQAARGLPSDPVLLPMGRADVADYLGLTTETVSRTFTQFKTGGLITLQPRGQVALRDRSEEHTSELQSLMRISYAVFCLKKKKQQQECIDVGI